MLTTEAAAARKPARKMPPIQDVIGNGLAPDLDRAAYDRLARVNWSTLKEMGRSPLHYRHRLMVAREDSDAMKLGRAVHLAVLEPEKFAASVVRWDGGRRAGKEWQQFVETHQGLEILTEAEHETCLAIASAVRADAAARPYLEGGPAEASVLWTHDSPGAAGLPGYRIDCKARLDFIAKSALVDLKSCRDASPEAFGRAAWNNGYLGQAAYYADGYAAATGRALPFVFVAVESSAPFAVAVYRVTPEQLAMGREQYRACLDRLHVCRRDSMWPGYATEPTDLLLPRWATGGGDDDVTGLDLETGD